MDKETKEKLNLLKADRKVDLKAIKERYAEDIKAVIQSAPSSEQRQGIGPVVEHALDTATLRICRPFVEKTKDIEWKRRNPDERNAHYALLYVGKHLDKIQAYTDKGKSITKRQQRKLTDLYGICEAIAKTKKACLFHRDALSNQIQISELVEKQEVTEEEALNNMFQDMTQKFSKAIQDFGIPQQTVEG